MVESPSHTGLRDAEDERQHAEVTQKRWGAMRTVSIPRTSRHLKESDISKVVQGGKCQPKVLFRHTVQVAKVTTEVKNRQKGDRTFTLGNGLQVVQTAGEDDTSASLVGHTFQSYKIMLDRMQAAICFQIPLEGDGGPPGSDGLHVPCDGLTPVRYWGVVFGTLLFTDARYSGSSAWVETGRRCPAAAPAG